MKSASREHQKYKVHVMCAEDIKCGMDDFQPTADEAQALHFFLWDRESNKRG
jgi:hypothetical protein